MSENNKNTEQTSRVCPQAAIIQLVSGVGFAFALKAALDLNLFSILKDNCNSVESLGDMLNLKSSSLHRLLRALQVMGVLRKDEKGNYIVTEYGEILIPESPGSIYPMVKYMLHETVIQSMLKMDYSVKTGKSSFEMLYGNKYDKENRDGKSNLEVMDKAMKVYSKISLPSILNAYNFEKYNKIVDIAGGIGQLLFGILKSTNHPRGVLFDLAGTIETAKKNIENTEVLERCQLVSGSIFEKVPGGGDLYIVSKVLNNWDEEHAVCILKNIRKVMLNHGRVIIIENIPAEGKLSPEEAYRDLFFLVCTNGGGVRNKDEFEALISKSGLKLLNVIKTSSSYYMIECVKA